MSSKIICVLLFLFMSGCILRSDADLAWIDTEIVRTDEIYLRSGYYDLHIRAKNFGSETAAPSNVEFRVNGRHFMNAMLPELDSDEQANVNISLWMDDLKPGNYTITAVLDSRKEVSESNESNNILIDKVEIVSDGIN